MTTDEAVRRPDAAGATPGTPTEAARLCIRYALRDAYTCFTAETKDRVRAEAGRAVGVILDDLQATAAVWAGERAALARAVLAAARADLGHYSG